MLYFNEPPRGGHNTGNAGRLLSSVWAHRHLRRTCRRSPCGHDHGLLVILLVKIRPSKPSPIKKAIYECGFETLSGTWNQFNFRYYSFALIFVIFDIEVVFLFPWAARFGVMSRDFGMFVLFEMAVFIAVLVVGWLYAWRKGALEWARRWCGGRARGNDAPARHDLGAG